MGKTAEDGVRPSLRSETLQSSIEDVHLKIHGTWGLV